MRALSGVSPWTSTPRVRIPLPTPPPPAPPPGVHFRSSFLPAANAPWWKRDGILTLLSHRSYTRHWEEVEAKRVLGTRFACLSLGLTLPFADSGLSVTTGEDGDDAALKTWEDRGRPTAAGQAGSPEGWPRSRRGWNLTSHRGFIAQVRRVTRRCTCARPTATSR